MSDSSASPSAGDLEATLRNLPSIGTRVKDRGYRQVWRFEQGGKAYYLKFYPRGGGRDLWRRFWRGSPALREFTRLQWLQQAKIPAPRAVAYLGGFRLEERVGDAVILEAIEPSVALDDLLVERELSGQPVPEHYNLAQQVIDVVHKLGAAKLGHDDLHLGNFLLKEGKVYLIDGYAVRKGGLRQADVLHLGAGVMRFSTTADRVRGWRKLAENDRPPPVDNPVSRELYRVAMQRVGGGNRYIGRLKLGEWTGVYFRQTKHPRRWSVASALSIEHADWERAWPELLRQIETDALKVLKRSKSGDVLAGGVTLGGRELQIILKRPRRRYWYRYFNEIGRGARPRRAWTKAWAVMARGLPTAWPLAVLEKRSLGYVTDTFFICEKIEGPTLWTIDLDALTSDARDRLFRRTGKLLRTLELYGWAHFDAKASNWIIREDSVGGPSPVLIDVDGVRFRRWIALGIRRLLKSMQAKKQYTREDSLSLCLGYAPFSRIGEEEPPPEQVADVRADDQDGN